MRFGGQQNIKNIDVSMACYIKRMLIVDSYIIHGNNVKTCVLICKLLHRTTAFYYFGVKNTFRVTNNNNRPAC